MNKQDKKNLIDSAIRWVPEGKWVGAVNGRGVEYMAMEEDLTLSAGHTMNYTEDVS